MIPAAELAALQAVATASGDTSIEIQRRTKSQGPTGNVIPAYAHLSTVTGTLAQPTAAQLQNYDYVIGSLASWQVRLPAGTDVQATDHLIVNGATTLEVQVVLTPQSYPTAVRLLATALE